MTRYLKRVTAVIYFKIIINRFKYFKQPSTVISIIFRALYKRIYYVTYI